MELSKDRRGRKNEARRSYVPSGVLLCHKYVFIWLRNVKNRQTLGSLLKRHKFMSEGILELCYATPWRQFSYKQTNDYDWLKRFTKIL